MKAIVAKEYGVSGNDGRSMRKSGVRERTRVGARQDDDELFCQFEWSDRELLRFVTAQVTFCRMSLPWRPRRRV
jgi:hypothetical protein